MLRGPDGQTRDFHDLLRWIGGFHRPILCRKCDRVFLRLLPLIPLVKGHGFNTQIAYTDPHTGATGWTCTTIILFTKQGLCVELRRHNLEIRNAVSYRFSFCTTLFHSLFQVVTAYYIPNIVAILAHTSNVPMDAQAGVRLSSYSGYLGSPVESSTIHTPMASLHSV